MKEGAMPMNIFCSTPWRNRKKIGKPLHTGYLVCSTGVNFDIDICGADVVVDR